ncbi:MAG TPA: ATP-binding protein, partial [Verrucomicrobiae bacterium]|nr:ATP-binding protein [Verrucomicrobiae bacterium]
TQAKRFSRGAGMPLNDLEAKLTPRNIVLLYLITGIGWAVLSAAIHQQLLHEPDIVLATAEVAAVVTFLTLSALLLFFLIRRNQTVMERRKESLHRVNRALKAFSECNQALIRARDEMQLMHDICRTMVEVGGYRVAWVGRACTDGEKRVTPVAQHGDDRGYLGKIEIRWSDCDLGNGPTGTAIRTGSTVVVQDILTDPRWTLWREKAEGHGFAASISLPLNVCGERYGALVIFSAERWAFDAEEVKLLEELAEDLSFGLSTLRVSAEGRKVEAERKLLAAVIEQAMEGIILFDPQGVVVYANHAVEAITGRPISGLVGRSFDTAGGGADELPRALWEACAAGDERTRRFIHAGADGSPREIEAIIWTISAGGPSRYATLIRDVTHEVHLERQLRQAQRMEAIASLAGGIAHDFNNNLASIITCTEMAADDLPAAGPTRELLDVVLRSAQRARNLVRQILTFSRQGEQERQPVQVEQVVQESVKLLRASVPSSIQIRARLGDRPALTLADPTQVHQIVMNLCTNACHAMRPRGGVLEVSVCHADLDTSSVAGFPDVPPGGYVELAVSDTGHGMDRSTMERIFDPFFTTKGHAEGTGLGLSVIHGIVRSHGGAITVDSAPGRGATFRVYLPRIEHVPEAVAQEGAPARRGNERILLVDDEKDLVYAGKKMLERLGHEVVAVSDPAEALELFRAAPRRFDLVITDHAMPLMNGMELAREMTCIRGDIPIILCTGLGQGAEDALSPEERLAAGVRELAMKPLERAELTAVIRRALDRRKCAEGA